VRRLVVFDYQPEVDDQRENLERARTKLAEAGMAVTIETFGELVERGRLLPPEPIYTGDTDQRLAMILYTSGSTGLPKGAMYTERMVAKLWTNDLYPEFAHVPVLNVNFMPLNHVGGRIPLSSSCNDGFKAFPTKWTRSQSPKPRAALPEYTWSSGCDEPTHAGGSNGCTDPE
jgi:fatty acid CoA ligase FadD9